MKAEILGTKAARTYKLEIEGAKTSYYDITDYCGSAYIKHVDSGVVHIFPWDSLELKDFMRNMLPTR
jgi:hypothetical protein